MKSREIKEENAALFTKYFNLLQEEFEETEGRELSQRELSSYLGLNHRSYLTRILSGLIYELSSETIQELTLRLERFLSEYKSFASKETFFGRMLLNKEKFQEIKKFYQEYLKVIFTGNLEEQQNLFGEKLEEIYENLIFGTSSYFPLKALYFGRLALVFELDLNKAHKLLSILNKANDDCNSNRELLEKEKLKALSATLHYLKAEVLVRIYKRERELSEENQKEFEEYLERAIQAYSESIELKSYPIVKEKLAKIEKPFCNRMVEVPLIKSVQDTSLSTQIIPLLTPKDLEDPFGYWRNKFSK